MRLQTHIAPEGHIAKYNDSGEVSNWGLSGCLTEQISMFLGDYSSVTPFGRATFPHKGRLPWYVFRFLKTENILIYKGLLG